MQSLFNSFGLPSETFTPQMGWTAKAIPLVLSDTPNIPTRITLDSTVRAVRFWTNMESVRYALDADPEPFPPSPIGDLLIPADAFYLGDVILPNQWHSFFLPNDSEGHTLSLISQDALTRVTLVAYLEGW